VGLAGDDRGQVPGEVRLERFGTAVNHGLERRAVRVQLATHAGPLRALAGEYERDLAALARPAADHTGNLSLRILGEPRQRPGDVLLRAGECGPHREVVPAVGEGAGEGKQVLGSLGEGGDQ